MGRPGAHSGMGLAAVAAWWVETIVRELGEKDAPTNPTQTTEMAKMRIARSTISNLSCFLKWGKGTCFDAQSEYRKRLLSVQKLVHFRHMTPFLITNVTYR